VPTLDEKQEHKGQRLRQGAILNQLTQPVRDVGQVIGVRGCPLSCRCESWCFKSYSMLAQEI